MEVAILVFDGMTALDAVGPYEVLSRLPDVDIRMVSGTLGDKRSDIGSLGIHADALLSDVVRPDIVIVSGGTQGVADAVQDAEIKAWLRTVHETSRWTTSVCTGALILGAAGLLEGRKATTHWRALDLLEAFGAIRHGGRVVEDDRIVTSSGVTAGIDMALYLVEQIAGSDMADAVSLSMEYQLEKRFGDPDPECAPQRVRDLVTSSLRSASSTGEE